MFENRCRRTMTDQQKIDEIRAAFDRWQQERKEHLHGPNEVKMCRAYLMLCQKYPEVQNEWVKIKKTLLGDA